MKKLLLIIVVIAAVMGNSPQANAHEGQNVVRIISGIGGAGLLPLGAFVFLSGNGSNEEEFAFAFGVSSFLVGAGTLTGSLLHGLLGNNSPHDYSVILTVSGAIATGVVLTLPYTLALIPAVLIPVTFIIDTLFLYGPLTDYRASLTGLLIRVIPTIPGALNETYYGKGVVLGAVVPPAIWLLGLGIVGLALGDSDPLAINNDDGSTIRFSPLYGPDSAGFTINYSY